MPQTIKQSTFPVVIATILFGTSFYSYADTTQIGRYMTAENKPRMEQINLLSQTIQIRFPQNVQTIGDAMNYLLKFSGYSLIPEAKQNATLKATLKKPLPAIDRNFGPMTLKDALSVLAGPAFYLVQDPVNRMADLRLLPAYEKLYSKKILMTQKNRAS